MNESTDDEVCTTIFIDASTQTEGIPKQPKHTRSNSTQTPRKPTTGTVKTQTFISLNCFDTIQMNNIIPDKIQQTNEELQNLEKSATDSNDEKGKCEQVDELVESNMKEENCFSENDDDERLNEKSDAKDENYVPDKYDSDDEGSDGNDDKEHPESKDQCIILSGGKPIQEQLKLVVFEEQLMNAFGKCRLCDSCCKVAIENKNGSSCNIAVYCLSDNRHDYTWSTGPTINKMPAFHLLLAAGIVCTGLESSKVLRLFEALKLPIMKQRELSNLLKKYVIPSIYKVWGKEQGKIIDEIAGKSIKVASDMRVDSPGHSGLLGSGSTLDVERNIILDTQVIKVIIYSLQY